MDLNVDSTKGLELLNEISEAKNKISAIEFSKYIPMFVKELHDATDEDEMADLNLQWNDRIDLYKPVIIVNDMDDTEILKLPPMFSTVATLNEGSSTSNDVVQFFGNAIQKYSPINTDGERASKAMSILFQLSNKNHKQDISDFAYDEIMTSFKKATTEESEKEIKEETFDVNDKFDWD